MVVAVWLRLKVHTLDGEDGQLIRKFVQLFWQRSKVGMPERILGTYPVVRVQLQERTSHHLTLDNIVQPGEA